MAGWWAAQLDGLASLSASPRRERRDLLGSKDRPHLLGPLRQRRPGRLQAPLAHLTQRLDQRRRLLASRRGGIDIRPAHADAASGSEGPFVVFCYFSGAWDTLLSLDPRSDNAKSASIDTSYDVAARKNDAVDKILSQTKGSGLVKPDGSKIAFGAPARMSHR